MKETIWHFQKLKWFYYDNLVLSYIVQILFIADAELVSNKIAKTFLDLSVTWNGGFSPILGFM